MSSTEARQDNNLDDALEKTQQLLIKLQCAKSNEEETARRLREEEVAHNRTRQAGLEADEANKQKLLAAESERVRATEAHERERQVHANTRIAHEMERAAHETTRAEAKAQLDKEMASHRETREALEKERKKFSEFQQSANRQMSDKQQDIEILRIQLKSCEDRSAATDAKLLALQQDYDELQQAHGVDRKSLQSALQAQEAYREVYHKTSEELQAARAELQTKKDELSTKEELLAQALAQRPGPEDVRAQLLQTQEKLLASMNELESLRSDLDEKTRLCQETQAKMDTTLQASREREVQLSEAKTELQQAKTELTTTRFKAREICNLVDQVSPPR